MDIKSCIEARLSSIFDTDVDFNFKSLSGKTTSKAVKTAGTNISTPSKSNRNKSAEFDKILARVSPHSRGSFTFKP